MDTSTDTAARGRKLRRHAERLGFTASRLPDGFWRVSSRGESAVAGPLERCEAFLADRATAVTGRGTARSPSIAA